MKKRLLLDMDGILTDFMGKTLLRYNWYFDTNYTMRDLNDYHLDKILPKGDIVKIWFSEPGYYADLLPLPGSIGAVDSLSRLVDIFVVTSPGDNPECIPDKSEWLNRYLGFLNPRHRIYTGEKHLVSGDFLIDDSPHNLIRWGEEHPEGKTIAIKYPYNEHLSGKVSLMADGENGYGFLDYQKAWNQISEYVRQNL